MQDLELARNQVAKFAGTTDRTIAFWVTNGVLRALEESAGRGTGAHRRFSLVEARIARVLAEVSRFQIRVEILRSIAAMLRHELATGEKLGVRDLDDATRLHARAMAQHSLASYTCNGTDREEAIGAVLSSYPVAREDLADDPTLDVAQLRQLGRWIDLMRAIAGIGGEPLFIWVDDDANACWALGPSDRPDDPAASWLCVNLKKVFSK